MLEVFIAAVISVLIYTIIRYRCHGWTIDSKMSRRKGAVIGGDAKKKRFTSQSCQVEVIDISDDDSCNESSVDRSITNSKRMISSSNLTSKFELRDHIITDDEEVSSSVFSGDQSARASSSSSSSSSLKRGVSLFSWLRTAVPKNQNFTSFTSKSNKKYQQTNKDVNTCPMTESDDDNLDFTKESLSSFRETNSTIIHDDISHKQSVDQLNSSEVMEATNNENLDKYNASTDSTDSEQEDVKTINMTAKPGRAELSPQHDMTIAGIKVTLPVKPYSCQVAVMNMLVQGCTKEQNCLLESPTGSGKTLALLCGTLAWQNHYAGEIQKQAEKELGIVHGEKREVDGSGDAAMGKPQKHVCDAMVEECDKGKGAKKKRVPKIYYGSRTHKQIEQVIRELRKTVYKDKRMTILSSREHTCLQESKRSKTELCNELLDPLQNKHCQYYNDTNRRSISTNFELSRKGLETPWDIEDLVNLGKKAAACPYFAARALMVEADIIFCPYNYLIDPEIRNSLQINLEGEIVILDEAHNIEDICRDVGSVNFRLDHVLDGKRECEMLLKMESPHHDPKVYEIIRDFLDSLSRFISAAYLEDTESFSHSRWTGEELLEVFNRTPGLERLHHVSFINASSAAIAEYNDVKESLRQVIKIHVTPTISYGTKKMLEHLIFALEMISSDIFTNDYRAYVQKMVVKDSTHVTTDVWIPAVRIHSGKVRTLHLICMNPAAIFAPLANTARSIILASGTLAPTNTFQSELGTKFSYTLQANHVISKDQVYIRGIASGPTKVPLKANYTNVKTWPFQDELGRVLLDVCETVPHGILCFFSSYNMMNMQINRWMESNYWLKLSRVKKIFTEPRFSNDLVDIMRDYRNCIASTSNGPQGEITGALLFAVFRGKVAEGIDFSDNDARCVLTVGIPFAVKNDPMIQMKVKYNDLNKSKGLLKGDDWYTVQAFRALNQALGRCIRHKNDWGAVLVIDERFLQQSNINYLPKWVRSMWTKRLNYNLREDLQQFVEERMIRDEEESL
ncbi:Fanconi anemia group J protein homolog isoform X2 [Orussus abietinus]|uniref:Fanconi anemia group J protein homolog isoform X2 n=1 Tax=Orussus abietinus TaxID=222816 RepID=UPI000626C6DB|nr:Fanconi anemia group J protein homolog isoform X2 [Orussus abietinus]